MDDNLTAITIFALLVSPFLLWLWTRGGNRGGKQGAADAAELHGLWETAQRLERRMESLEMLLDSELPGWRSRSRTQ